MKRSQKLILESRLIFGQRFAKAIHPVYQDKIDSYRYGAALSLFIPLKKFFGSNRWNIWVSGDYLQENNEVAFFDSNLYGVLGGLMYRFDIN